MSQHDDDDDAPRRVHFDHERPLDNLLPELAESRAPLPATPLHQRVLEVDLEDAGWEWLLCAWRDPGGARAFHEALRPMVEATLLAALSRPPASGPELLERRYRTLRLMVFDEVEHLEYAVRAFGLQQVESDPANYAGRLGALVDEAQQMGFAVPQRPRSVWAASIAQRDDDAHGHALEAIQRSMAERMGDDVWGATPGGPSRLAASLLEQRFAQTIEPDLEGLETMERLLVSREPGVVRWMPPLLFQALCDFIGVVAHATHDAQLAWAVCEEDVHGLHPPPHFRWEPSGPSGAPVFVPVGLHVLRWCIMPIAPDEDVPSLSQWLVDQFGSLPN